VVVQLDERLVSGYAFRHTEQPVRFDPGFTFAKKLDSATQGAEAMTEKKAFIAALEALRHPKASPGRLCRRP
jgi:hypothetical protein